MLRMLHSNNKLSSTHAIILLCKGVFFAIEKEIIDFLNISLTVNLNLRKYFIWGSAFLLKFSVVICSIYLQFGEFEKVPFSPKEIELR